LAEVIENPILNSPYREPTRHFHFDDDGITSEIVEGRRESSFFIPIAQPKKRGGGQLTLPGEGWTAERLQPNAFINQVREQVALWRRGGYPGITSVTRDLLEYWTNPGRNNPLFFCQIEALETAVFLTEVAGRTQSWIENRLREANEDKNPGLYRIGHKMATGSGKTVVMCMFIAWHTLNKLANPQDRRFSDAFLVVTPGITIRERLQVLLPNLPGNYYRLRDLVTEDQLIRLQAARIVITNFHALMRRDTFEGSALTKKLVVGPEGNPDRFRETAGEMVRRVCRAFGSKRNIVVLNDEAHHCYQSAPQAEAEKLSADDRAEVKREAEAARVWLNGLRAVREKIGIREIHDLSATPFFLRGSGYPEGTLFPWVVSDFSLIDAIESGIVKIPRVPVSDDAMTGSGPMFRDIWSRVRDDLPRKGRASDDAQGPPIIPKVLEGALVSLYGHYERSFEAWRAAGVGTPPVFIVVCQNTAISKLVFDWLAGYEKPLADGTQVLVPGALPVFSNVANGAWLERPNSLLIDSAQLESGEALDPAFKRIAATEIEEFKREWAIRSPGRSAEEITDEDLLREVMNTIGKQGRLGEQLRCVVSVSMLTEGWDATTVTHILGVRAFGTQLLCEQVVGRGLRRTSYEPNAEGMFEPEYAEVYGVPFSFIPTAGQGTPTKHREIHRIRALPERADLEITFPRVIAYRWDMPTERLSARFTDDSTVTLSTADVADHVQLDPIVGESTFANLDDLRAHRLQQVAFVLARRTLDDWFADVDGNPQPWLFPQVLAIARRWLAECVVCKDGAFPQLLLLAEESADAAARIYRAIVRDTAGEKRLLPILRPYEPIGSTRAVDFDTTKAVYATTKSHLNYVVLDSGWEAKVAEVLESMPDVTSYVKNQGLNFKIPYTFEGHQANYVPDLIVRTVGRGLGADIPSHLVIEVTGEKRKDKAAKVAAARDLWIPAMNNDGQFGRWFFLEVTDPWDAEHLIRAEIEAMAHVRHVIQVPSKGAIRDGP
jgi:type III restriction enzyme